MAKMDDFERAVAEESKRRGLVFSATCSYCGEVFLKQKLDYVLAHSEVCEGRQES